MSGVPVGAAAVGGVFTDEQVEAAWAVVDGLRWRYVAGGQARTVHAVDTVAGAQNRTAMCGMGPGWWRRGGRGWQGDGNPGEYKRAAELPRCTRCVRTLRARLGGLYQVVMRPAFADPVVVELYDWLAANQVREWLPEDPMITIDYGVAGEQLTYASYQWCGFRGWDQQFILLENEPGGGRRLAPVVERTVPLLVAPSPRIRDLAGQLEGPTLRWWLSEHPGREAAADALAGGDV